MIIPLLLFLAAAGDHGFGVLPPVQLPDIMVTTEDNQQVSLRTLANKQAVAIQFVFTDCVTVCPLLGSLFQSVEKRIPAQTPVLLLSVSVNPERDDADRLKEWLGNFRRGSHWRAIRTSPADLPALLEAFGATGAFALANDSRDAALVATLAPGRYSVLAQGVNGTTGTALVEVYEIP